MTRTAFLIFLLLVGMGVLSARAVESPLLLLVNGAPGEPAFASNHLHQVELWQQTGHLAAAETITIGVGEPGPLPDRDRLQQVLKELPRDAGAALWLVLIGHGTFDGKTARFNLRGPDISAAELKPWLEPLQRQIIVINTASASAPFIHELSSTNRIVITATRSGSELNYTRFGRFLAESLADPDSDFDRDGQTSLLEAFLAASAKVRDFYVTESRLATEHALIDDNGDGKATPAEWFRGVRARKQSAEDAGIDGARAHQVHLVLSPVELALSPETRAIRDALEQDVFRLRDRKAEFDEEAYFQQLESILLRLARLYQPPEPTPPPVTSSNAP